MSTNSGKSQNSDSGEISSPFRVAIVGGGPGGLFAAWHLVAKAGNTCDITIFEASERVGGKIITKSFPGVGIYEAGVAEIYDYSALGPDPLRELITEELGLSVRRIDGGACVIDGKIIASAEDMLCHYDSGAHDALAKFRKKCIDLQTPEAFYTSERNADNAHPWALRSGEEILETEVGDPNARRYVRIMSHSDVAAPPHLTNGITFLKNLLMDIDGYLDVISVDGGNEKIVTGLVEELDAEIRLNSTIRSVQPLPDGTSRLEVVSQGAVQEVVADFVVLALPLTALSIINWRSPALQSAMNHHIDYFDRPGHYLRATLLFQRPFWREHISGDWWMTDAFDGCCVYDEGSRQDLGQWGALGFLIAGNAALGLVNMPDERIIELCLDTFPPDLEFGKDLYVESRIHRWMASVNAIPGGYPLRPRRVNHSPDPEKLPGIYLVGDYMFDATLNGALDSADSATDLITSQIVERRRARTTRYGKGGNSRPIASVDMAFEAVYARFFAPAFIKDMIALAWSVASNARVLLAGSLASRLLPAFRECGINAWSIAPDKQTELRVPRSVKRYHKRANLTDLPFADGHFAVVIETDLCRLELADLPQAIQELKRVTLGGIICGSINTDLTVDLIERYNLVEDVKLLMSRWEWADHFYAQGLKQVLTDPAQLAKVWERVSAEGAGPGLWYEDAESILYSLYMPDDATKKNAAFGVSLNDVAARRPVEERVPVKQGKLAVSSR